jgi:asparagine synthase (glutamine-hydrolysing)
MCGICGKLSFDQEQSVEPNLIEAMTNVIAHRGPDGSGIHVAGPIGLGHRRLSIIDLTTGDQPMCNEDGTVWVVYNGEIYNYQELRTELLALGHRFKSATDTEVLVHAYEEWGEASVARMRGMFAYALWDARKRLLLLARDRVGVKPLYYANTGSSLLFGSEMKSLLVDVSLARRVNPRAIDRFLAYHYLPGNETLFEGVSKLDPGHYLVVLDGRVSVHQYWDLRFDVSDRWSSLEEASQALEELLRRTVKDHMISDVPVGVLLSGGVDSSAILGLAATQTSDQLRTFTVGFDGESVADERPFARLAAQRYGTQHHEVTVSSEQFREFLPKFVWHMEEPVCEPPGIALYFVSQLARATGTKVLLSGEGGDEAFGGYEIYRNLVLLEQAKGTLGPARPLLSLLLRVMAAAGWRRAGDYSSLVGQALHDYYVGRTATPMTSLSQWRQRLYRGDFARYIEEHQPDSIARRAFRSASPMAPLNHMLYVDTKSWLPDDLLVKADKMTMAASTELRVPLLDYQILEFGGSLPSHFKVQGVMTKRVLKEAIRSAVPAEIVKRKKAGFPVPYERWLRGDLRTFIFDTLLARNSAISDYFEPEKVRAALESSDGSAGLSKGIFSLVVLELWHQQFAIAGVAA